MTKKDLDPDPFMDPRAVEADARHSRRRRRGALIYGVADRVFFGSLLVFVVLGFKLFLEFMFPFMF